MEILRLAVTNSRAVHRPFGIKAVDRLNHAYVIGETGVGKTTFLEGMVRQDIARGVGCAFVDPHGDISRRLLASLPPGRDAILYVDLANPALSLGYNPLTRVSSPYRPLVASGLISVMKKMWLDAWGVRMEHILRNTLLALLDQPKAEMPDVLRMLGDKHFRAAAILNIENDQVRTFWTKEFPGYQPRFIADAIQPIQNKVGAFLTDPRLRRFVCPEGRGLRFREIAQPAHLSAPHDRRRAVEAIQRRDHHPGGGASSPRSVCTIGMKSDTSQPTYTIRTIRANIRASQPHSRSGHSAMSRP